MATKIIRICDKCKKEKDTARYELKTDYCCDRMYTATGTAVIDLCKSCAEEIKRPFLLEEG